MSFRLGIPSLFPVLHALAARRLDVLVLVLYALVLALTSTTGCGGNEKASPSVPQRSSKALSPIKFDQRASASSMVTADGQLEVVFVDLKDDVGLVLRSADNVLVKVDVDQDGKPTSSVDRTYGVDLDTGRVCAPFIDSDPSMCSASRSAARGAAAERNGRIEISLRIPKRELGSSLEEAHVVFELFSVAQGAALRRYPDASPFLSVYRLVYAPPGDSQSAPDDWPSVPDLRITPPPPPSPPQPAVRISADPRAVYLGDKVTLSWVARGARKVTLEPGFGEVEGEGERVVSPEKKTTYVLTVEDDKGTHQEQTVIDVKNVEVIKFLVLPRRVHHNDQFSVEWSVKGATSVNVESVGWPEGAKLNLPDAVRAAQSKFTLRATRDQFRIPGRYQFRLTAQGPGGPKTTFAELIVLP